MKTVVFTLSVPSEPFRSALFRGKMWLKGQLQVKPGNL